MKVLHCFDKLDEKVPRKVFTELLPSSHITNHITSGAQLEDDQKVIICLQHLEESKYSIMIDELQQIYFIVHFDFVIFAFFKSLFAH